MLWAYDAHARNNRRAIGNDVFCAIHSNDWISSVREDQLVSEFPLESPPVEGE
jgi:hypothetical protein